MNLSVLLIILWSFRTIISLLQSTYYWQLKEYRWDRMKQFLFEQNGSRLFFGVFHQVMLSILIIFFLLWLTPFQEEADLLFPALIAILFLGEVIEGLHQLILRRLKRPRLTLRSLLTLILAIGLHAGILIAGYRFFEAPLDASSIAVLLSLLFFFDYDIVTAAVGVTGFFSSMVKRRLLLEAQALRLRHKTLRVIGITGSFGKSSTKEYLAHILEARFKVLKTEKNINTEIGIAQTMKQGLTTECEVFVAEMGAYRKGEIELCCALARPEIGIFTGLNAQHRALFGDLDATFKAKWELMTALPQTGLMIINADCDELKRRVQSTGTPVVNCSINDLTDIRIEKERLTWTLEGVPFEAPLIGGFQAINVLMAIRAARYLGLDLPTIASRVKTLKGPDKTMTLTRFTQGYLLEDSYNVNPDGLKAALTHLDLFPDYKKIIIFPGNLELGEESPRIHEEYGEMIAQHVDYAFFSDSNFSASLSAGALRAGLTRNHIIEAVDMDEIVKTLKKLFDEQPAQWLVFVESRGADKVIQWLINGQKTC